MNYNMYTSARIAYDIVDDRQRQAKKERRWIEAIKAKRALAKLKG